MKKCSVCKAEKQESDFHKCRSKRDGLQSKCKTCMAAYRRQYARSEHGRLVLNAGQRAYRTTPKGREIGRLAYERKKAVPEFLEGNAERLRRYRSTEQGKTKASAWRKAYKERNREKVTARKKFENALKAKLISRCPCEVCGNPKSQGHHTDYTKALEVRWLCRKHHMEAHAHEG
jgi:tRNA U34 5-carboxymethylaminomethyl modifying enzyme MnmG/GidA